MMIPLGVVSAQQGIPQWTLLLDMRFNNNFDDSAGRHTPVNYGATISSAQSVEGATASIPIRTAGSSPMGTTPTMSSSTSRPKTFGSPATSCRRPSGMTMYG